MKGWIFLMLAMAAAPVWAQLDETCVASALNRTAPVDADGVWVLPNVPANLGQVRVRATCVDEGRVRSGQSDFFTIPADGILQVADIVFDDPQPVSASLSLTAPETTLTAAGQTVQVRAMASFPDGSMVEISGAADGTSYTVSNSAIATVTADGLVTAVASGTVLVSAGNEGALGLLTLRVVLSGDSDGDGLPDDFELANGLDPSSAADAFADPDGDGLSIRDELESGLDPFDADTDDDGLTDGEEAIEIGSNPLLSDTDGDRVSDGLEVAAGSDPSDPQSVDLAPILEALTVEPSSFHLTFNTVVGEASRRLQVAATLLDGTVLDATGPPYGVSYASSDLTIASFGAEAGRVFAGQDGTTAVAASIGDFSASSEVTVRSFSPTALSFIRIPGFANDVAVQEDYAYVAAGARGLYVVNVGSLTAPAIAGSVNTPGNANGVAVAGDYAYVADGGSDLRIVDVGLPSNPTIVGAVDAPGRAVDVAVADGRAYLASGIWGLHIIDVSDPTAPTLLGSLSTGDAHGVAVADDLVIVADGTAGVLVIDASDPTNPSLLGSTPTRADSRSAAAGVALRDGLAWVADGSDVLLGGLRALDVSEASTPAVVGSTDNAFGLTDVVLERDFALASDYFFANAVPIFNISGPSPVFTAVLDFSGAPSFRWDVGTGLAVQNGAVFLTGASGPEAFDNEGKFGDTGLHIGRYLDPESISNVPPEVTLVEPVDGATALERRRVTMRADATDDVRVAVVEFFIDGETVRLDFRAPFEHTFRTPAGGTTLTLGAVARDLAGNESPPDDIQLEIVPDADPTVSILSPLPGSSVTEGTKIRVDVLASDDAAVASVELSIDGASPQIVTEAPYVFDVTVPLDQATFQLSAEVTDDASQTAFAGPLTLNILEDQLPQVSIVEPVAGAEAVASGTLRVVVGATDDLGVDRVRLRAAGALVAEDLEPPYAFDVAVPSTGGELILAAEAVDILGQIGDSEEIVLAIVSDPLTTVFGRVLASGVPVVGATLETVDGLSSASDGDGFFSLAGVSTVQGEIVVLGSAETGGVLLSGQSAPVEPVAGGITDVGDVELTESVAGDCLCVDPANWSDAQGGQVWSGLTSVDLTPVVQYLTCTENSQEAGLTLDDGETALGLSVSAASAACHAFTLIDGIRQDATLPIPSNQVEVCRGVPLGIAQNLGVACVP